MATWLYTDTVSFGSLRSYYPISFRYAYYVESTSSGRRLNLQIQLMNNHSSENYTDTLYACGSTNGTDLATLTANGTSLVTSGSMNLGDASYPIRLSARQTWYTLGYDTSDNTVTFVYDFSNNSTAITVSFNGMFSSKDFDTTPKRTITHTFYFNSTSGGSTISGSPVAGMKVKMSGTWLPNSVAYAKHNGTWKEIKKGYAKVSGIWKQIKVGVVDVVFRGAISETLTITDSNGNISYIPTNASGSTASTSLVPGTYTATGSVSGYTTTLNITAAGTYNVYPAGALYWYGLEVVPFTVSLNQGYSSAGAWKRTNYFDLYGWSNSNGATGSIAQARTTNTIDTSIYSKINYRINVVEIYEKYSQGTAEIRYGHKTATGHGTLPGSRLTSGNSTYTITSPGTSTYPTVSAYTTWGGYSGNYKARCYVYAIWGE